MFKWCGISVFSNYIFLVPFQSFTTKCYKCNRHTETAKIFKRFTPFSSRWWTLHYSGQSDSAGLAACKLSSSPRQMRLKVGILSLQNPLSFVRPSSRWAHWLNSFLLMGDSPVNPADQKIPGLTRNCYAFKMFFFFVICTFSAIELFLSEWFLFLFCESHRCIKEPAAARFFYFSLCEVSKIIFVQMPCFCNVFLSNLQCIKYICALLWAAKDTFVFSLTAHAS